MSICGAICGSLACKAEGKAMIINKFVCDTLFGEKTTYSPKIFGE